MSAVEQYEERDVPPRGSGPRRPAVSSRVPPHNLAAEESLLGAMLLSKDAIASSTEVGLTGDDFYKPAHGHIYTAICGLYSRGEPVDPVTVAEVLRRQELLDAIGGTAVLVTLQASTPATTSAGRYARIIEEHALLRRLIGVAGEIAESAYGVPDDVTMAIDRAESMVYEVAQRRVSDSMTVIGNLLDDNLNRLEALYERGEAVTGIPTGYTDLDDILAGLQPANLVVVGARPAMGKCARFDTRIVDPHTGAVRTIEELVRSGEPVDVPSLWEPASIITTRPVSAFVDDGVKPTWTVRTKLGREVTTTATHPYLTYRGWKALAELAVGDRIAVPRVLPFFGSDELPDEEVTLLGYLLGDGSTTTQHVAFTSASPAILAEVDEMCRALGAELRERPGGAGISFEIDTDGDQPNPVVAMLERHGLLGLPAHDKHVPEAVFRLPKDQVARFLSRLFASDGSAWWSDSGDDCISYRSVSKQLARDVQHLLLRFGINGALRTRQIAYRGTRSTAYELELRTSADIVRFTERIGIFSKEAAVDSLVERQRAAAAAIGRTGEIAVMAATRPSTSATVVLERPRPVVGADDSTAASDISWDEIVAIEYAGEQQVYDLTVDDLHNFVADDVCVHNTAFSLGLASNAALESRRPVLVFSLEMSQLEVSQRILCADARVDSSRVRTGRLTEADWGKISHSVGRLADAPIYIDDNANVTVMDIRAKARRMRSQLGDLGVIIIDYIQLMTGRSNAESRQVEVSEISRNLKILARELETPVVALAQLNRQLEQRADKRPMLSDLRESGCLTAGTRLLRADTGAEVTLGELLATGARDVPVWSLDDDMRLVPARLTHAFASGTKEVFRVELASGRMVEASANHPFLTIDGWTRVDEMDVGARVAVPRSIPCPQRTIEWPDDEVIMLAHLIGDGCTLARQPIHYTSADEENLEIVEKAAARFGIAPRRVAQRNWSHVYLPSPTRLTHGRRNPIAAWLDGLGAFDRRSWEKVVPAAVFSLDDRQLSLFIRHLWATDGSVSRAGSEPSVYYASSSRRLVDDLRLLLLRFGIQTRLARTQKGEHRPGYQLHINGARNIKKFAAHIGVYGERGRRLDALVATLTTAKAPYVEALPREIDDWVAAARRRAGLSAAELARRAGLGSFKLHRSPLDPQRLRALADALDDEELRRLATADVTWDRVVAIEPLGEQPVFDATVAGTHNFVANGICLENSLEQDADIVLFLYRDEVYNPDSQDRGTAEVLVAKHRNGPVGKVRLAWLDHYTKFANMAKGV